MKMCVFSGTFNPIHNGHLYMAEYALEKFGFSKILFIPAFKPPFKESVPELTEHRFNMVKLAIENNPQFEISDIEYRLGGKSYTYRTICELYKEYEIDGKISFIIGTDAFETLDKWYESEKLRKLVDFIVFVRKNDFDIKKYDKMKEKGYLNRLFATERVNSRWSRIHSNCKCECGLSCEQRETVKQLFSGNGRNLGPTNLKMIFCKLLSYFKQ